jgi:DNA topoisomerase I
MAIMIIAEKPDAAEHIARALSEGGLRKKKSSSGIYYWEFQRDGLDHIVVAAVGHLFSLKQKTKGWGYPVFSKDIEWMPSFKVAEKSAFSERYYKTIEEAGRDGTECIVACDYDNEGSLIGYNILRFILGRKDAKRMFFSTLTKHDLEESYENVRPHLDWENITSGETRHFLDWLYGINTSRALTLAIKKTSKRFTLLTAGRVQGPTLSLLAEREAEIKKFIPIPFWQIELRAMIGGSEIVALHEKDKFWEEPEADKIFSECKSKPAIVDNLEREKYKQLPPPPFNITSLQTEAYRLFRYSPQQTLSIAQKLYTSAYISYPRTSSEKLPPQINYKRIITALSSIDKYKSMCRSLLSLSHLSPREGAKTDPAHEAIHPTDQPPTIALKSAELRIYDLICRRFMSTFAEAATKESIRLTIDVNKQKFLSEGTRTVERGWTEYYGPYAKSAEMVIPELKKGTVLDVTSLEKLSKETAPPSRYSQASIIKEMEKRNLGTRATRSNILQTLYDRNYIVGRSIQVTDLGMKVANTLRTYVPDFVDEGLTRKFEEDIEKITSGELKKEDVLAEAEAALVKISEEFKENEDKIGKELGEAASDTQNEKSILGKCSACGGDLKIMYSPLTKKNFVGCSSYSKCKVCGFTKPTCRCICPKCSESKGKCKCSWKEKIWTPSCQVIFPLPHGAAIYGTDKVCDKCKTPIISVYRKGRRPFKMCIDTKCETKAEWGKPKVRKAKNPKGRYAKKSSI